MESLLFGGVAAVLGEGLDVWGAAEEEDSHRDLRWWEAAELGGLGALPPAMFKGFFLLPIDSYTICAQRFIQKRRLFLFKYRNLRIISNIIISIRFYPTILFFKRVKIF